MNVAEEEAARTTQPFCLIPAQIAHNSLAPPPNTRIGCLAGWRYWPSIANKHVGLCRQYSRVKQEAEHRKSLGNIANSFAALVIQTDNRKYGKALSSRLSNQPNACPYFLQPGLDWREAWASHPSPFGTPKT
jgi:hypothetical protein